VPLSLQAVQWEQQGLAPIAVCVHVSALQFRQNGFVNRVATILKESGLAPEYLEPEITESLIVSNSDVTLSVFRELNELGVKCPSMILELAIPALAI
jgi:EAL domain-containing protein (putative c-di-GMP-specific phosphodiesterase class I)